MLTIKANSAEYIFNKVFTYDDTGTFNDNANHITDKGIDTIRCRYFITDNDNDAVRYRYFITGTDNDKAKSVHIGRYNITILL